MSPTRGVPAPEMHHTPPPAFHSEGPRHQSRHKKTPSLKDLNANHAYEHAGFPSARGVQDSPMYEDLPSFERDRGVDSTNGGSRVMNQTDCGESMSRVHHQMDDDELNGGSSLDARLEELTGKLHQLTREVTDVPEEPSPPQRPAIGPPQRPPRLPHMMPQSAMPGYGCMLPAEMTNFAVPHCLNVDELLTIKMRVRELETTLRLHESQASTSAKEEISILRKQLESNRAELQEAREEIQQNREQIALLTQRLDTLQGIASTPLAAEPSCTAPVVTPRSLPMGIGTPQAPPAPSRGSNHVPPLPMAMNNNSSSGGAIPQTARIQGRPASPHDAQGQSVAAVSSSPLPTARMQRQASLGGPQQGSYAPAPQAGSYAPPAGPQRVLVATPQCGSAQCGSARASPMRPQFEVQTQSTACVQGTSPHTARMGSSFAPPARGHPIKVGAAPAYMVASPRMTG